MTQAYITKRYIVARCNSMLTLLQFTSSIMSLSALSHAEVLNRANIIITKAEYDDDDEENMKTHLVHND